jgi:hypothetical protein
MVEMTELVLVRALTPFPIAVRTLDALHLPPNTCAPRASRWKMASYDDRLLAAARPMSIPLTRLTP